MPIYEFRCQSCGNEFEKLVSFSDTSVPGCPACQSADVKRQIAAPAIHFKGSGWYVTDSKKSSAKPSANGAEEASDSAKTSEKESGESTSKASESASDSGESKSSASKNSGSKNSESKNSESKSSESSKAVAEK